MNPDRKRWNKRHQILRQALHRPADPAPAIALFLEQHALVHSAQVAAGEENTFADEVWEGLSEAAARYIPPNGEHSIIWCFWHLARIEDVTMNVLLAGRAQLFEEQGWAPRLKAPCRETGNALAPAEIAALSATADLGALRAYRDAVGRRTREIVRPLQAGDLAQKVAPGRLQRLLDEGAVVEASRGLLEYWGGLTHAGLLLMPPTRHNLVHLNEALQLKRKAARLR